MASRSSLLTTLLPSTSYLLVYTFPLFFLSFLLTFAGAFLTLDRTRSFPPDHDAVPGPFNKRKVGWRLEGGVGGLVAGCVFGIHFSTFLTLIVPVISTSSALTGKSFLPVWFLSAIITAFLAGRWKHCALAFSGISGGALLALSLCVIVHPSLITRVILTAVITPILAILTLLPLVRFQHAAVRFAMSVTGAFGVVLAIALLSHIPAWGNVWERYWDSDSLTWGTSKEKGLSAAFSLFLCAGMACDWLLSRMFGECPDEKWDHYLANYAANLPNRAGTFRPLHSFWDSLFIARTTPPMSKEMIFPTGEDMTIGTPVHSPFKHGSYLTRPATDITAAKKARSQFQARRGRRKEAVKFDYAYSSDSDEDAEGTPWPKKPSLTPTGLQRTFNVGIDDTECEKEKARLTEIKIGFGEGEVLDYSDFEEDVTQEKNHLSGEQGSLGKDWSPEFLHRHQHASVTTSSRTAISVPPMSPPPGAVPITPSLMKALDRVAAAQKAAFVSEARQPDPPSKSSESGSTNGLPTVRDMRHGEGYNGPQWDEFWDDVRYKAGH